MHKYKILLIGDDIEQRSMETSILEAAGFLVVAAGSGDFDSVEKNQPDMIVCNATRSSDPDLCAEICAKRNDVPLLFVTEPGDDNARQGFPVLTAADDQIESPIEAFVFIAKAAEMLGYNRHKKALIASEDLQRRTEVQLRLVQRLESVGRLAGGIAHDFNNMLTAINGYSDLTLRSLSADDPIRRNIEEIKKAGERSAVLTSQLLAFSRKQVLTPKVLDLNNSVRDMTSMLERLIGENIDLRIDLAPDLRSVKADPGQLTQVVTNLAVNARDAMPQGGELKIETANVYLDEEYAAGHIGSRPGNFVMLAVTDTGVGITEEQQEHVFEPFYTTKEKAMGTGLGLATVYGIVKQSEGHIWVDSKTGSGASFKIYLPRVDETTVAENPAASAVHSAGGGETLLLVEDEEMVRNLAKQILVACGYKVIAAKDADDALEILRREVQVDLLITDVVMPIMSGPQLAENALGILPDIKVLYMSGYTDDDVFRKGITKTDRNFIRKPFTYASLSEKVREILDS